MKVQCLIRRSILNIAEHELDAPNWCLIDVSKNHDLTL